MTTSFTQRTSIGVGYFFYKKHLFSELTNFGFLYATGMVPSSLKPRMATYFEIGGGHTEEKTTACLNTFFKLSTLFVHCSYTEVVICKYVSGVHLNFRSKLGVEESIVNAPLV
jgi:hypothetical protein